MAEVKGVLVTGMKTFLLNRFGKNVVDEALTTLKDKESTLIRKTFLDGSFYPYDTMSAMAGLTHALNPVRKTTGQELGTFLAEYVFRGPYKPLLAKDIVAMAQKIGWIKDFFYRDTYDVESKMTGDRSCVVVYRYTHGIKPTRGLCRSLGAFWGRTLELSGNVKIAGTHQTCIAEGHDRCEFRYTW
ncbi:MAG TPA: hypothetical protein VG323_17905 [Thermoanaerobaculia bacterium]|nr:hypothetical protein [Thermoanaerobaculia bacterium]